MVDDILLETCAISVNCTTILLSALLSLFIIFVICEPGNDFVSDVTKGVSSDKIA